MSSLERRYGATERVLGGSPMGVLVRLVVMSFVVGLILTMLDINPNDIINWVDQRFRALTNLGFEFDQPIRQRDDRRCGHRRADLVVCPRGSDPVKIGRCRSSQAAICRRVASSRV